jgi:prophage regulatory protein
MSDKFLRLPQILGDTKANPPIPALIPVCKTTWYAGIKNGIYPKGIKLSPRVCVWRESSIHALINQPQK